PTGRPTGAAACANATPSTMKNPFGSAFAFHEWGWSLMLSTANCCRLYGPAPPHATFPAAPASAFTACALAPLHTGSPREGSAIPQMRMGYFAEVPEEIP